MIGFYLEILLGCKCLEIYKYRYLGLKWDILIGIILYNVNYDIFLFIKNMKKNI